MSKDNTDRFYKLFGLYIRKGREERGLYQREVAAMVDLSQAYYSQIEAGLRRVDFELVLKICSVLDLNVNDFITMFRPVTRRKKTHPE